MWLDVLLPFVTILLRIPAFHELLSTKIETLDNVVTDESILLVVLILLLQVPVSENVVLDHRGIILALLVT
jgi:hypothetical protein